ncbi:MAG: beta-lactamase family protein [Acidobacteriota bacterium]|nr:beta-lactamase family protein [Acidobacteriota bacterium]
MRPLILILGACCAAAAAPNPTDIAKSGLDPARLAGIPVRMKQLVGQGLGAGCVTLVQRHGVIAELDAVGMADIESKKPMRTDTIFQIMSMTKPITAVGAMMLVEEGKLALNESVEKYLPEFHGQTLAGGEKPARPITLRDLMTHTSGMGSAAPDTMKDLQQRMNHTLADAVAAYAKQPLAFEPGAKWSYSNNGIATLGRLIEVASGMPYEKFIETRILAPLGMKDSFFFPPRDKIARIALVYQTSGGKPARAGDHILGGDPTLYRKGAIYPAPEWGLYSTAEDLARFYQMMLNGGTYRGRRYLSKMAVDLMRVIHTGDIAPAGWLPLGGSGYGLAWEVTRDPTSQLMFLPAGTYGHGGAFGTQGWIDPKDDLIRVLMIQGTNAANGTDDFRAAFLQMAGSAVE